MRALALILAMVVAPMAARAVAAGKDFLSPGPPFVWIDGPPSLNRLIWLR